MNANELADLLEVDSWYKLVTREEIATMLRQQQERILELEACINDCYTVQKMQADECYKVQAQIESLKERNKELESFYRKVKARMDI